MKKQKEAWIISVDMGYGHQRAAYPLKDIAYERIITANSDKSVSMRDHRLWEQAREFYEFISRLKDITFIGKIAFKIYDNLQKISPFFPFRDLSKPNFSVLRLKALIKKGFCKSIVDYTSKKDIPVITTHFIPAMAFNYYKKEVYCVVTDTDIHRIWVPDNPKDSTITYFSPCRHVTHRLLQYGVSPRKIIETGFPLPKENIGNNKEIVKKDILSRLVNLDPKKIFFQKYAPLIKKHIEKDFNIKKIERYKTHRLTLMFTIGGAGAQTEIADKIINSLHDRIKNNDIKLIISVGTKIDLKVYFEKRLAEFNNQMVEIIFSIDKKGYFEKFNDALRKTDILWTKPSEMSFYSALGIPIIIAPPIGAHEVSNKEWLEHIGAGLIQQTPEYVNDWLFYWLEDGRLADAAIQGFMDAPLTGTYNIEKAVFKENI
ncbi:MAG: hypothetical protein KatS3mg002_0624 [Candidatus Woesearchaeota archaeon]|nr:MAG: hypothetical protein KatS3mg002_0624 [Candidatus Woesearchaeota archaeon]